MKLLKVTTWTCGLLAFWVLPLTSMAEEAAEADVKAAEKADEEKPKPKEQEQEKSPAPEPEPIVLRERPPLYDLQKLIPKQSTKPTGRPIGKIEAKSKPQVAPQDGAAKAVDSKPGNQRVQGVRRPPAPFWSPQQGQLGSAAAYRLGSMGHHVHLSPAMRFHLNRYGGAGYVDANASQASASTVPGEGAQKFYPGVSRSPTQKPFADVEPQPNALQRYWPLLLEGREDPNTGLIIWSLP